MGVTIIVNGARRQISADTDRSLLEVLRDELGVTGPKFGCGEGACGACTVLIAGRPVTACTTRVGAVAGRPVTTVEGLAEDGFLHPVQQAWLETGAMQCGYCTPGWLTATAALLSRVSRPDDTRIAAELAGHICRCCTYPRIVRAVRRAAELMAEPDLLLPVPPAGDLGDRPPAGGTGRLDAGTAPPIPVQPRDQDDGEAGSLPRLLSDGLLTVATARAGPGTAARAGSGAAAAVAHGGPRVVHAAWVHVGADGLVTAFTGKVEAGQATRSALALLVAEELAVRPSAVRMVMGDTRLCPFDAGTFGSRSIPYAAPPLRAAAATARDLLVAAAAQRFGLPVADLAIAEGVVAGPDGAPTASYSELLAGVRRVEQVPRRQPLTPPASWRTAGRPARSPDGADVVTGRKRFPADLALDGMWHGCVLRPPAYGARLRDANVTAAQAIPGVIVIREGDFIGVAAADRRSAQQAIDAIDAAWTFTPQPGRAELPAYLRSHLDSGTGPDAPFRHERGSIGTALAAGPVRLEASYSAAYIAHVPLEPRSALAAWQGGQLTVWTGTSTPFRVRSELAGILGVREQDVRVVVPDYGGGFGGKHGGAVALEAARLARAARRPVKVQWSRDEEFRHGYLRPAAVIDISSSARESGEITGWSFTNINSGSAGILSPYRIPHQRISYLPARSPLPQGSYRALAATANHFARESHMDELAWRLAVDPLAFRLRHLDDERLAEVFQAAAGRIGWRTPVDASRCDGTGMGIAGGIEKGGRVATAAEVRVGADGVLHVDRLVTAFDCGTVVNPDGLTNQIEGATMMALGGALFEAVDFASGRICNASLAQYRVPRLTDLPQIEVVLLDRPGEPSAGGGETPMVAVAPAIANGIYDARRIRLRSMPLAPDGRVRPATRSLQSDHHAIREGMSMTFRGAEPIPQP
jgi:nicotinate dehydrogenase subunit B